MAFNLNRQWRIPLAALLLAGCSVFIALHPDSPRRVVVGSLLGLAAFGLLVRDSKTLSPAPALILTDPLPTSGDSTRIAALEARLEHAPVALFSISAASVESCNAHARRLYARARDSLEPALTLNASRRALIDYETEGGRERALIASADLKVWGNPERIVAVMPVESELEAETLKAWQQLVRVLTHEIMNSLTPVASLSQTAAEMLEENAAELPAGLASELGGAMRAVSRRAANLADFVTGFRSLSAIGPAHPQAIDIKAWFDDMARLVEPEWSERGGRARFIIETGALTLMADRTQLEQALINLLRNAANATQHTAHPEVTIAARLSRTGRLLIEVTDNGPGIPEAIAAQIFTPFFTTQPGGQGIGLALTRQLVHANGGTVRHIRNLSGGACFLLTF